jgi:alpha-galactosidase
MEEILKQMTQAQIATYYKVGCIILKDNFRRAISLVFLLFLVGHMAYSQTGFVNLNHEKVFSKWSNSELVLNNGIVQRIIKIPNNTGSFITTSYGPIMGKFHYFLPENIDFQFEVDGFIYSGKSNWNLVHIKMITDDLQGNGAAVILQSIDNKIELTVNYLMYPGLPVIRKYLSVKNLSNEEISLESVDVEKLNFANSYPSTYSWIFSDYARRKSIGPYEGNMQDALVVIHDSDKEAGIIVGNEASGVLKRTSVFWNAQDICIGLTHKDARFPFRKWIKTGESFETPKVFSMVYNNQKDPNTLLNTVLPDFIRKHMGIRLSELKQKPTFVYNTWNPFKKDINEKLIMELAKAAAEAGMKEFVIDDGWEDNLGDWGIDKRKFPNGLKPVFDYIKSLGMKPGLWISVGSASSESKVYHEHPEWFVKDKNDRFTNLHIAGAGDGINDAFRSACFSTGWKDYIKNILLKLTLDYGLEYMKLDFSVVTSAYVFDHEKSGCYASNHQGHKDHNESLYSNYEQMWNLFDELHAAKPNLFIDCTFEAMGGLQLIDYAMLKHAEGNWLSNFYAPDELGDLRIRNIAWWRSPAMSATALVIGNPKMDDKGWELHIKSLAGALPIMLGDPRKLTLQDLKKYRSYADWLQSMQSKYDIMSYRQDLDGFGEPMQGMWDGFQRINTETQSGGIVGVFRHGSLETERYVRIKHLNPQKKYIVKSCLSNVIVLKSTGADLAKIGFKVKLANEYSGELFEVAEVSSTVQTKSLFFDFGTNTSRLVDGFTAVTPDFAWSPEVGVGWVGKPALAAVEKADLTKVSVLQRPLKPGMPKSFDQVPVFLQ